MKASKYELRLHWRSYKKVITALLADPNAVIPTTDDYVFYRRNTVAALTIWNIRIS